MKDIVFYYTKRSNSDLKILKYKELYPFAKFVELHTTVVDLVKNYSFDKFSTDLVWFIDINLSNWEQYREYDVEQWDKKYVHVFKSKQGCIYLIPSNIIIDQDSTEFKDKKIVNATELTYALYDIFFISYDENSIERNLNFLLEKRPDARHISNIKGIFNAHLEAARLSTTDFFWVVDADATVLDSFDFDYRVPEWDFDVVHIWKSVNPINFLEYGYGGVKLIPKHLILNADEDTAVDVTTSIGAKIKIMNDVSNINNFATSPFAAWRSAFRECAKLSSGIIKGQIQEETDARLNVWLSKGGDRPLGEYVRAGASAGEWYGKTYSKDKNALACINDYEWLAQEFETHIKMFPPEQFKQ